MCTICDTRQTQRRNFLTLTAAGVAGAMGLSAAPARATDKPKTTLSADDALARLQAGNATFTETPALCAARLGERRAQLTTYQAPWATILSCADSRVPPELLFGGLGLGQLFVARNAGNMVDTATMGTIEYGAEHLGAPLVVVLGHESCGAVAAACDVLIKNAKLDGSMGPMVQPIVEVAKTLAKSGTCDVDAVIRESAIRTAKKVAGSPVLAHKKTKVVAARYDLDNGKVEFL